MLDPREGKSELPVKSIPCESQHDQNEVTRQAKGCWKAKNARRGVVGVAS